MQCKRLLSGEAMVPVHPTGAADFVFRTADGPVSLRRTGDALTPYGGLEPWAALRGTPQSWSGSQLTQLRLLG